MIAIMRDGMGVGLAATQLGVLRRLLVFQAGPDGEPTALVNPMIEWLSDEGSLAEEGCLSLPRVTMDVERPLHARISGRDAEGERDRDRGLGPGGARPPARDRPPRRRPDPRPHQPRPAQGRPAGAARGRQLQPAARARSRRRRRAARATHRRVSTVYLGTSDFAATVLRTPGRLPASPVPGRDAAGQPPGPRPQALAATGRGGARASWGSSCCRPRTSTPSRCGSGSPPPGRGRWSSAPSAS